MNTTTHPWASGVLSREPFLIVAGGYRCGSTSLYTWLADHPQVNPCTVKEPAFFFSLRMLDQPPAYPPGHEADAYLSLFRRKGALLRMEATPNYLEDPGCAERIRAALPETRIVILLREPVSRLVSWYRLLQFQGRLSAAVSFEQWVTTQLEAGPRDAEYLQQAVAHGHYAASVAEYVRVFGRDRVHVIWFDDFERDPRTMMRGMCRFAGIAEEHYDGYRFERRNQALRMRRPRLFRAYRALHRSVLNAMRFAPRLEFSMRSWYYGKVEPRLLPLFTAAAKPCSVPPALRERLQQHYRPDIAALRALLGTDPPWRTEYEATPTSRLTLPALADSPASDQAIVERARPYTMAGATRTLALVEAVGRIIENEVPGAFVECGVWRGGSVLAMLLKLQELGVNDRDIYLYDTFEGMTAPTAADTSSYEPPALRTWRQAGQSGRRAWGNLFDSNRFSEAQVRRVLLDTGYPESRLHFIRGPVEQTLPASAPTQVALLRLDTDWYESTRHELQHLYPRVAPGGVLLVDDYGHWDGCRRAVDEYFASPGVTPVWLQRIDYTGRIAVRT